MKLKITLLVLFVFILGGMMAQDPPYTTYFDSLMMNSQPPEISESELEPLRSMPQLPVPDFYLGSSAPTLPYALDNSQFSFFRPPFNQEHYSCGQATFVSYNFNYEVNRLRNLPGNVPDNQYPTHFSWNWINGGNAWYGGSYFHTAELLKHVGTPNVTTYGGMAAGGGSRWMSGYDKYYQAMSNRIHDAFAIDVSTIEGLQILKHYLHDHLEGSEYGGVASFYANHPGLYNLPAGTPEAGKKVVISWVNSSHAMTIVGYNDSIRWDYNGDGQYTNHLDINGDGVVDLRDWEIGGLLMLNSFGGVPNWGDGGYAYMMYKTLADPFGGGGIWNNAVHVVKPKTNTQPLLTMKVELNHTSRDKIKVTAGLSLDPNATAPSIEMDFPIFDFHGGDRYMQGGTSQSDKTIEFGLDITPLLSHVPSGQTARYFLRVYEKDPNNQGVGEITYFSVRNYTSGMQQIVSNQTPTPIIDNGITTLWVNAAVNYNSVNITTNELPDAKLYEPYSHQLQASGGTAPYHWYFKYDYDVNETTQTFPQVSAQQLNPTNSTSGYATKILDFPFPYFGKTYDTLYLHVNGLLLFDKQNYPWPYFGEPMIQFRGYRNISLFNMDLRLYSGQGIWYEGDENSATFRWKASINGNTNTELNFAVKLYPNGDIEYFYGDMNYPATAFWIAGLSAGDYRNFQLSPVSGASSISANKKFEFSAPDFPFEFKLNTDGTLHGTPTRIYENCMVKVMAVDNNNLFKTKTLPLSSRGFKIDYSVQSGNDNVIEFGETATMNITLKSYESQTIQNAVMTLSINDPHITLIDNTEPIASIAPGDSLVFQSAFVFQVADAIPNAHPLPFELTITSSGDSWHRSLPLTAYAPAVQAMYAIIQDGNNGILDPGETTDVAVFFKNNGGALVNNLNIVFSSDDPFITINSNQAFINTLPAGSGQFASFNITASELLTTGMVITVNTEISGHSNYSAESEFNIITGILVESFESGNFNMYPWQFGGHQPWIIVSNLAYDGAHSAKSGVIDHNQQSEMTMQIIATHNDSISFYRRVSSEGGYDFLKFYVDNALKAQWSGEMAWSRVAFPVEAGVRNLKWSYEKDGSVVAGADAAWVDYIVMPPMLAANAGENGLICENDSFQLSGSAMNYASLLWTSGGDGSFNNPGILNPVYTPGNNDINNGTVQLYLTAAYGDHSVTDSITLSITIMAQVFAGYDDYVCAGNSYNITGTTASNYANVLWSTSGNGAFINPGSLYPVYIPGPGDLQNGFVVLTVTAYSLTPCSNATDSFILEIIPAPEGSAGNNSQVCFGSDFTTSDAWALHHDGVFWSTTGSGTFDDITLVNTTYTPSAADLQQGSVVLTMQIAGNIPCGSASDQITLQVIDIPVAPLQPAGPDSVNLFVSGSSVYAIQAVPNAGTYEWQLQPGSAGSIEWENTTATVSWNIAFDGEALVSVMALNDCGNSAFSEELTVVLYTSTIGFNDDLLKPAISISPNPGDGLFRLRINNLVDAGYTVSVYNLIGSIVYYHEVRGKADDYLLDLGHCRAGVYLLVLQSEKFSLHKKLIIRD